ncbi:MAG: peptide ABC transporter ATP-binding protein, partial [Candidatus Aenigmatarchaeota archaeon]
MPLLSVQNLKSYYILGDEVVKAVDDVSFEMEKGEIVTFVGESGSGKSTLGLSIIRLLPYPGKIIDGKIIFKGRDLLELSEKEMSKIRGKE